MKLNEITCQVVNTIEFTLRIIIILFDYFGSIDA